MQSEISDTHNVSRLAMRALQRARVSILTVAVTYLVAVGIGMFMVLTGNERAIAYRDHIVTGAQTSRTLVALKQNNRIKAALLDFGGNLYAAILDTIGGVAVIVPYPIIAYRGWVGGIVSIDGSHVSRLVDFHEAAYYLITLLLQLIPYALAGGAGVNLGMAYFKPRLFYQGEKWWGYPKEAVRDAVRIYTIVIPLFMLASLWEFLAR